MNTAHRQPRIALGLVTFVLIAVIGLFYVKWFPYYNRAFVAASQHSIGKSILMGTAASAPEPSLKAALDYALAYGKAIWQAMVLGLLLGSAVQALIPPQWVARALGRSDFGSVVNGGLMSLPGMMCTCCAAPVVAGLRARQAAPGAAIAFWLGNTVLNPAALVFMGFVLGWQWMGLRLGLGVLMVFGLGYVVNRMVTPKEAEASRDALKQMIDEDEPGTAFSRWMKILGRMTLRLVPEYIVLVLLLGAARAWLFPHIGPDIDNSLIWIVAFAVAGMLFVIPTAGEVPIIQAMLSLGMAAGPAGALLMTLPPISVPSLAMLGRSFPRRVLVVVSVAVVGFGIVAGGIAVAAGF
ncbi:MULTISPECIES: permease [unclassified Caballeronia]|uniref:permease n=1 Tax=unclassified Caballeronia TaxID=2646786 RepID=UPI00285A7C8F|nr:MULTISPECIES: permease [unclassified Caballeronia]MDR5754063.1 permease [Caballeronia sp. LZ024]MDR5840442.1 permease [Caballeronia sp. LZ031]